MSTHALLNQLKQKLQGFTVVDVHGQKVGVVEDLRLTPEHRINIWVLTNGFSQSPDFFLLRSRLIAKADAKHRSLILNVTQEEIQRLWQAPIAVPSSSNHSLETISANTYTRPIMNGEHLSFVEDTPKPPHPPAPSPKRGEGEQDLSPSPHLGEGFKVRVAKVRCSLMNAAQNSSEGRSINQLGVPIPPIAFSPAPLPLELDRASHLDTALPAEDNLETVVQLLQERLVVDRHKRKVGEVIVRKEVETRYVRVPVRHEKLIVEQVEPTYKQLAVIDLIQEQDASGIELPKISSPDPTSTVKGEFNSPRLASQILEAIASHNDHRCRVVRVEVVLEDPEFQLGYQQWFDRYSVKGDRYSEP